MAEVDTIELVDAETEHFRDDDASPTNNYSAANPLTSSSPAECPQPRFQLLASRLMNRRIVKELSIDETCRPLPASKVSFQTLFGNRLPPDQFSVSIFVFEFVVQWLHPITLPLLLLIQGRIAAENKGALPPRGNGMPLRLFLDNTLASVLGWLPQILVIVFQAKWAVTIVVVSEAYVFFRFLVIAGKYASYRHRDYMQVVFKENAPVTGKILIVAWKHPTPATIDLELAEAQERFGLKLSGSVIKLSNGFCVPTKKYLRVLLQEMYSKQPPQIYEWIFWFLRFGIMLYPLWVLLDYTTSPSAVDIVITVLTALQLAMNAPAVTQFLWVGYLSYERQLSAMLALLHAVVRSGVAPPSAIEYDSMAVNMMAEEDLRDPETVAAMDTMFSLRVAANVASLDKMRKIIRKFGFGYSQRISFNAFATAFVLAFLLLVLLSQALSSDPDWKLFAFVTIIFSVSAVITLLGLFAAMNVNKLDHDFADLFAHEEQLLLEEYILQDYATHGGSTTDGHEQVHLLHDLICAVRRSVQQQQQTDPVRVMYMPAKPELVSAFVGLLFSGLLVTLQIGTNGGKRLKS